MRDIINVNRAITLWPEWAYAVLHLKKDVENRPWRIPPGRYALHAGKHIGGRPGPAAARCGALSLYIRSMRDTVGPRSELEALDLLPTIGALRGRVVGVIEVTRYYVPDADGMRPSWSLWAAYDAINPNERSDDAIERPTIANPIRLLHTAAAPIPCRGQLGLWRLPTEIASVVTAWPMEPV